MSLTKARLELEEKTGKGVVSGESFLPAAKRNEQLLAGGTKEGEE